VNMEGKKNLVICAVGDSSLHKHWKPNHSSSYDLVLIYYGDKDGYKDDAKIHINKKGTKFHLIADFVESEDLSSYEYIWMPDDDLFIDNKSVEKIFYLNKRYDLWLSQPSIMGWYGLDVTLHHKNSLMRFTNYVEIMCPCFTYVSLVKCLSTFKENETSWGIDHLWNLKLGQPTNRMAIIDDVIAIHTRPVGGGEIYKNNKSISVAEEENSIIHKKYNIDQSSYNDLKNGKLVSQESFGFSYHNTVEYSRIYKQMEAGISVSKRIWPPSSIMEGICQKIKDLA
jgi:hypothetical protein